MLDQHRVAATPDEKREQLFTERYESLLVWALRLTNQQREAAEDLVQDAFVQFMLGRTRLEEIENIDGYLRRMLRYMHLSRISRSAQHLHETALSVADYDSCRLGWTTIEPPRRMQAAEELHQICTYACLRKESSRAGSVLILRFFHDYFPTEIASILKSSRHNVDQWQRIARQEAKLFMSDPGRLRFVDPKNAAERSPVRYLQSHADLMLDLRRIIFDSRRGECLSPDELRKIYTRDHTKALATPKLAHIVSCHSCLDNVNQLLGLPLLAQRYEATPANINEPPQGSKGGGASSGGSLDLTKKFRRRLREIHEHKPQELRIAINGFPVSSLKVNAKVSELNLNLTPDDPVEFVEVSSEQRLQLLFFSINPSTPQYEQWAWIELSEGRSLEACFQNENGPSLQVLYKDPAPEEALITGEISNTNSLSSPFSVVPHAEELSESKLLPRRGALHFWARRLFYFWKRSAETSPVFEETTKRLTSDSFLSLLNQSAVERRPFGRRLSFLIVFVSATVVAGLLLFKADPSPTPTATALLENAAVAERATQAMPDRVSHRVFELEERHSNGGQIVAQRKIETWENHVTGNRAQRLYGDSNQLLAAAWQKPDGSHLVYHHGAKLLTEASVTTPDNLLLDLEDVWQLEPSPRTFSELIGDPAQAIVEERATTFVLHYEIERTIGSNHLLKATLTLSKSNFHPVEQSLLVQGGNELREYRFVEASFELLPAKAVAPAVFDIEPELLGGAGQPGRPRDWALAGLTSSHVPPSASASTPPIASAELEVDVAYLLNLAKADRNEQVALTRSAGGSLRVEGVVDSQQRKEEFLKALRPVSKNPAVKIEIHTVAEAARRLLTKAAPVVQETPLAEIEHTPNTLAADEDLRAYLGKQDPSGPTDEAMRAYSSRLVNRAYRVLFHAIELKRLVDRFATVDMRTVAKGARAKWLGMLREETAAFARENALLRQELEPVFFTGTTPEVVEDLSIQNDADLARAVERLNECAVSNNDAIRSALTTSPQSSVVPIKSATFWQCIQSTETLAEGIKHYITN